MSFSGFLRIFVEGGKDLGKIFSDAGEDLQDFTTKGYKTIVVEGRDDYKFPSEIREEREAREEDEREEERKEQERIIAEPGDIIGVHRGMYDHYGVYVSEDCIIHYTAPGADMGDEMMIREVTHREFLGNSGTESCFILDFPESYAPPSQRETAAFGLVNVYFSQLNIRIFDPIKLHEFIKSIEYKVYSPEETVERAISRIGESKYNLATNNCEHFVIWCKTGISESHQVNSFIELLLRRTE
jgi:hypothetical protein